MTEFHHISVLLDECMEGLNIKPDGIYVDGTLGGAGHSSEIVKRLTTGRLIGIDRDPVALTAAGERLAPYASRVTLVHSNFCEIAQVLKDLKINGVDKNGYKLTADEAVVMAEITEKFMQKRREQTAKSLKCSPF